MQRISPCLWFNNNAEEAAKFYTSIFKNSKLKEPSRFGDTGPGPKGSVMVIPFELDGQEFLALNGGPAFSFTEAISMTVNCDTQEEIDYYWQKLSEGGKEVQCGWLKDKFGLSWQIVPTIVGRLLTSPDAAAKDRAMAAIMKMIKIDIEKLQKAYDGK